MYVLFNFLFAVGWATLQKPDLPNFILVTILWSQQWKLNEFQNLSKLIFTPSKIVAWRIMRTIFSKNVYFLFYSCFSSFQKSTFIEFGNNSEIYFWHKPYSFYFTCGLFNFSMSTFKVIICFSNLKAYYSKLITIK